MKLHGGNYVSGTKPFLTPHPPKPEPFNAVAGTPATNYPGDKANPSLNGTPAVFGQPVPRDAQIMVDGTNLLDVITALKARLDALENPTP